MQAGAVCKLVAASAVWERLAASEHTIESEGGRERERERARETHRDIQAKHNYTGISLDTCNKGQVNDPSETPSKAYGPYTYRTYTVHIPHIYRTCIAHVTYIYRAYNIGTRCLNPGFRRPNPGVERVNLGFRRLVPGFTRLYPGFGCLNPGFKVQRRRGEDRI